VEFSYYATKSQRATAQSHADATLFDPDLSLGAHLLVIPSLVGVARRRAQPQLASDQSVRDRRAGRPTLGGEVDVYAEMLKSRDQSRKQNFGFGLNLGLGNFGLCLGLNVENLFFCIRLNFNLEILVPVSIDLGLQNFGLCLGLNLGRKNFDFGLILSIENFGLFLGLGLDNSVSFNIAVSALADQSL